MAPGLRRPTYGDIVLRILRDSDRTSLHFLSITGLFSKGYLPKYQFPSNWRQLLLRAVRRLADEGSIVAEGRGNLVFRHISKPLRDQSVLFPLDGSDLSITGLLAKVELFPSTPPTSIVDVPDFDEYNEDLFKPMDLVLADQARFVIDSDLVALQLECRSMKSVESPNDRKVAQEAEAMLAKRRRIRHFSAGELATPAHATNAVKTSLKITARRRSLGSFRRAPLHSVKARCRIWCSKGETTFADY